MRFIQRKLWLVGAILLGLALAGCGTPPTSTPDDVARLEQAILALGPGIDPAEAARAAQVSYAATARLAVAYEIEDGPLVHNMKVNAGKKPRGLCRHWAEDMEKALKAEGFRTLEVHRAIANARNPILLEHSTSIISRKGDSMYDGIVVDPWREGGHLTWIGTREDTRYPWEPRLTILKWKQETGRTKRISRVD
ncbi:hypothetical protein FHY55_20370 [Oceanicola sp. D3]|uniref:hypothetical protein n=1 Tax=Oceanicola sp. D3 TaxID=2587163 RepID=UPI00111F6400|nr:hypothetical protein [Oceanicola sp. D3]QDC11440.1 hypothetical protein FHY55_20370 [Oceanicola sp. D3]